MYRVRVERLLVGDVCPVKSTEPIHGIVKRDEIQNVTVLHEGGYIWHAPYGDIVLVAQDDDNVVTA